MLVAYLIRGISGFGSGLIAVPLLALLFPLTFVVQVILITDTTASLLLGARHRRLVRWDELKALLPAGVVGVILGATLLVSLPPLPLLITLGVFVLAFGVRSVLNLHGERLISRWWAPPAGLIGGTVSALFGTGGPPYIIYLNHRLKDKGELRATFSALFLVEGGSRVLAFLAFGLLLDAQVWWAAALALPLMLLGLKLGSRIHVGIAPGQLQRLIGTLLLVSGTSLLWKAAG